MTSPNLPTRTNSLDFLLGVVTIEYPLGHRLVTDAFSHLKDAGINIQYLFTPLIDAIKECVMQQGVWGTRVGGKIQNQTGEGTTLFAAESGSDKKGDGLYREVKEFLVCFNFLFL